MCGLRARMACISGNLSGQRRVGLLRVDVDLSPRVAADRSSRSILPQQHKQTELLKPPEEIDDFADHVYKEELSNQEHQVRPLSQSTNFVPGCPAYRSVAVGGRFRLFLRIASLWAVGANASSLMASAVISSWGCPPVWSMTASCTRLSMSSRSAS